MLQTAKKRLSSISIFHKYNNMSIVAKATLWFMVCSSIQKCISIITTPIFTRMLTTTEYGQYSLYNSWLQIFTIVTTLRLNYGIFNKGMSKYKDRRDEYTSAMQGLTSVITLICFIVYLLFRSQINKITELSTFITIAIFIQLLVTPAFSFWTVRQRYEYKYKAVIFATAALAITNPLIGILAINVSNNKGLARILSCIGVQVFFGLIFYCVNYYKSKILYSKELWNFAFKFNLPLIPHYLSLYVLDQSDRIMIQKICGYSQAAIYSVAYQGAMVMKIVTGSINNAIIPWQYKKLEEKKYKDIKEKTNVMLLFIAIVSTIFMIFAPEIITILAGEKYFEAIKVIPPISASLYFIFLYGLFGNIEMFFDANKIMMYISIIGAILNLVLNIIFIPIFGMGAAGYTTLMCYILFCISHYIFMNSILKKRGINNMFDIKFIAILSIILVALAILLSMSYDCLILRVLLIVIITFIIIFKKDYMIMILKQTKVKKN